MQTTQHGSACEHPHDHRVDECPSCGCRSWPEFAVVSRYLWSGTSLGKGLEERTWIAKRLAGRLPQAEAEAVVCDRCALELDLSELDDEAPCYVDDEPSWPAPPLVPQVPFWSDRVVVCPDCGARWWEGFSMAFQYFVELNRLEGLELSVAEIRELAWSQAPSEEEYELCDPCTTHAYEAPEPSTTVTSLSSQPVFEPHEVVEAVEAAFPEAA